MRRPTEITKKSAGRGYALLSVIIFTVLILSGATVVLVLARDKAISTVKDKQMTEAYGVALAGVNWFIANVDDGEKELIFDLATGDVVSPQMLNAKNIHIFNPNDPLGGVPGPLPARGQPSDDWTPVESAGAGTGTGGHYGLTVSRDPLNQLASAVIRSVGVVGTTQVVLETNLTVNLTAVVPSGFVGCFQPNTDLAVELGSGPQDFTSHYRFDGNGGAPMAFEVEHNRFNGLARMDGSNPAAFAIGTLPQGRQWRGTQSLGSLALPAGVATRYGGLQTPNMQDPGSMAPIAGWERNPALANDPRLVDMNDANKKGIGLSPVPAGVSALPLNVRFVTNPFLFDGVTLHPATVGASNLAFLRAVPLIAFKDRLDDYSRLIFGESQWAGDEDQRASTGFYGCNPAFPPGPTSPRDPELVVSLCLLGAGDPFAVGGATSADPDFNSDGVQESGLAWGVVQSALRHCTGSGDSVDPSDGSPWRDAGDNLNGVWCEEGFDYLKNVAACLVVPRSVTANAAGGQDNSDGVNRGVSAGPGVRRDARANTQPDGSPKFDDDFMGCHPGCLIAVDGEDDDGAVALQNEDRPFRSACINLDSTKATTYGPTAYPTLLADRATAAGLAPNVSIHRNQLFQGDGAAPPATMVLEVGDPIAATVQRVAPPATPAMPYSGWQTFQAGVGADMVGGSAVTFLDNAAVRVERVGGAVSEVGSPHFITRLDLTDRGPLGTCEQNCLAYHWGQDVTFGAHRTDLGADPVFRDPSDRARCAAKVPVHGGGGFTYEHCNLDYDRDGFLDRKSFALASSYREECADDHDGISWAPAVNINESQNTNIAGAGCANDLPNFVADQDGDGRPTMATYQIKEFCGTSSEQTLNEAIDALLAASTEITPAALNKSGPTLMDGEGWFGGARCHMGADVSGFQGHPTLPNISHAADLTHTSINVLFPNSDTDRFGNPDYWIEDVCPDPVVLRMKASANVNLGDVCGCGVLIFDNNHLDLRDGDHFLWRGIVVWNVKDAGGKALQFAAHNEDATFVVEGSMIAYGGGKMTFKVDKDVAADVNIVDGNGNDGHVKLVWRLNEDAINDALSAAPTPLRVLRRVR
jgi:hypothetical protein